MPQLTDSALIAIVIGNEELPLIEYDQLYPVVRGVMEDDYVIITKVSVNYILCQSVHTDKWIMSITRYARGVEVVIPGDDAGNPHKYFINKLTGSFDDMWVAPHSLEDEASAERMMGSS